MERQDLILMYSPYDIPPPVDYTGKVINIHNQEELHYVNGNLVNTRKLSIISIYPSDSTPDPILRS